MRNKQDSTRLPSLITGSGIGFLVAIIFGLVESDQLERTAMLAYAASSMAVAGWIRAGLVGRGVEDKPNRQ